ncbi:aspartate 1-decarboxylase [Pectinatus sottacetonis]|uniref:aspartate 1-decarboxylase n=1 Tax=Pectinatus sottacetonis TaxID=1002795 RepID=UPI0018C58146|nr:aspartate 1-decarboxylase [Pectinatus sottacetonis]
MIYNMFHGKIHRAIVTQADLSYVGSIIIDETLMELAGILPGERVQIVNNNNGARLETYVIAGKKDSGIICLNGAAARKAAIGDTIIIIAYALMNETEARTLKPKVVIVDANNHPVTTTHIEQPCQTTQMALKENI